MILEFSIENFLSFKDRVSFSMLANSTSGLSDNYIEFKGKKILKTAAVYGANASGKSNLFAVLNNICLMIKKSNNNDINAKLPIVPFKFADGENNSNLSSFEIKFIKDNIEYVYGFSANANEINEEYLYYYPNGKKAKIFDRTNIEDYSFIQTEEKELSEIAKKTPRNKFFLSTATNWNYAKTKPAYDFLTIDLYVCFDIDDLRSYALKLYNNDKDGKLKEFALKFLKEADFDIIDYEIKLVDVSIDGIPKEFKNMIGDKVYMTTFTHAVSGREFKLDYGEESIGTQIIFILIPIISLAMEHKKVLIVDELDRSIHPTLLQYIISTINDSTKNVNGSQLIFNTHDTNLLNLNLLRRDQIWFTEKIPSSSSSDLYSLSDFSVRNNENIERGYLLGRYGAIPFINEEINIWKEK